MSRRTIATLDHVLDLLLDVVCLVDTQGRFVFLSAASERLFGYPPDELEGRAMIDLVHPDDRRRTLEAAARVMAGDSEQHFENRYLRRDGRVVHVMWSARWSPEHQLRVAVARDVTELRRAERLQSAVYRIAEAAHQAEGLDALYREVHRVIGNLLPAACMAIALRDSAGALLRFAYWADEDHANPGPQALDSDALAAVVVREGRSFAVPPTPAGRHGRIGVPLRDGSGVIGALIIGAGSSEWGDPASDHDLLELVSTQVAAAIERKQGAVRLEYRALHDALTELPNRTLIHDRIDMALARAKRDGLRFAVLYLDLDGFKAINDHWGHDAGDAVLRAVAARFRNSLREADTVARVGGDEFAILLERVSEAADVVAVVRMLRAALAPPFEIPPHGDARVGVSIGVACYPDDGIDRDQLLSAADAAMYAAKRRSSRARRKA